MPWRPRSRRARSGVGLAGALLLGGTLALGTFGGLAGAARAHAAAPDPLANPTRNVAPPTLLQHSGPCVAKGHTWQCASPCVHVGDGSQPLRDTPACTAVALAGIDAGRRAEGLSPIRLPGDYTHLSVAQQLFVLVDLERVARGVPPLVGLVPALDGAARTAALAGRDPAFARRYGPVRVARFASTWAGGAANPAAAVFDWIYDDGWGGPGRTANLDCTGPHASGCWGHRDALLGRGTGTRCTRCLAGAGFTATGAKLGTSMTFLVVDPAGAPPTLSFTWEKDVLPALRPSAA